MKKSDEFSEWAKKVESCGPCPIDRTSILIDEEGMSIEVLIDPIASHYAEWIRGEGGDIALLRNQEPPNNVVGVRLPLKFRNVMFSTIRQNSDAH